MKVGQYVRLVDSESIGRIVRIAKFAVPPIATVRWLTCGFRASYYEDKLRVLCPTCACTDRGFSDEQLERARLECEECLEKQGN